MIGSRTMIGSFRLWFCKRNGFVVERLPRNVTSVFDLYTAMSSGLYVCTSENVHAYV